jgi:hypothetical protein
VEVKSIFERLRFSFAEISADSAKLSFDPPEISFISSEVKSLSRELKPYFVRTGEYLLNRTRVLRRSRLARKFFLPISPV